MRPRGRAVRLVAGTAAGTAVGRTGIPVDSVAQRPRAATLGALGLEAVEERVYRHVLSARAGSARIVARVLRLPLPEVERALERLTAAGLVTRVRSDVPAYVIGQGVHPSGVQEIRYVPEPPSATLGALLETRAAELVGAGATLEELCELFVRGRGAGRGPTVPADVVEGVDEVNRAVHDLLSTTGAELLNLDRQPFARASSPYSLQDAVIEMLGRGVEVRTIYAGDAFRVAGYASYMQHAARLGERARLLAHLPVRFVVSDRDAALLPLAAQGPWVSAALVVRGPVLVADLVGLFDELWLRASVLDAAAGDAAATLTEPEFTEQEIALLRMLADDLTETAIGRHLGASARTVGRRVALLQRKLGASTRFGLGAEAARRGLV